jgi:DNA-binding response OmpR family regulator
MMIAQTEKQMTFRPRLVLAYADSAQAALSCRHLRRQGWEVHLANSGPDARRLARLLAPQVVVLDIELRDESGWLTCAKLKLENPTQTVVLVAGKLTAHAQSYADFVGAATIVERGSGMPMLMEGMQRSSTISAA